MVDSRMITFTVDANTLSLAPRGDVPLYFPSQTSCIQCTVCFMVWRNDEGQITDPTYGHVCDVSPPNPAGAWSNWGASSIDPGPNMNS